jgi:predicted nucleic-acid-binding protein
MIGLDTNVVLRYLAEDDPLQSKAARDLIEGRLTRDEPGHIAAITIAEIAWVLKRLYAGSREEIADAIEGLLAAPTIVVEHRGFVRQAVQDFRESAAEFSDCVIGCVNAGVGCDTTVTFDRAAAKVARFRLLA